MNGDEAERLTAEALRRFATPEAAAAYVEHAKAKEEAMRDHERRLTTLEVGVVAMQAELKDLSRDAQETRVEQNGLLKAIGDKVDAIAREQTIEAGRREGAAAIVQRAEKAAAERGMWARSMLPVIIALGVYLAAQFVGDAVSVAQTAAETEK